MKLTPSAGDAETKIDQENADVARLGRTLRRMIVQIPGLALRLFDDGTRPSREAAVIAVSRAAGRGTVILLGNDLRLYAEDFDENGTLLDRRVVLTRVNGSLPARYLNPAVLNLQQRIVESALSIVRRADVRPPLAANKHGHMPADRH